MRRLPVIVVGLVALGLLVHPGWRNIVWSLFIAPLTYPPVYFGSPIEGRVLNSARSPVAGALVTALWELRSDWGERPFRIDEVRTDSDGRYRLNGWGPALRWPLMVLQPPVLVINASGYLPRILPSRSTFDRAMTRSSQWAGKDIELEADLDRAQYARRIGELSAFVDTRLFRTGCHWEQAREMVTSLLSAADRLGADGSWDERFMHPAATWHERARHNRCAPLDEVVPGGSP